MQLVFDPCMFAKAGPFFLQYSHTGLYVFIYTNNRQQILVELDMQGDEEVGVALLTYPVLMASDILLYQVISDTNLWKFCRSLNVTVKVKKPK